jgi:hypothetical protein
MNSSRSTATDLFRGKLDLLRQSRGWFQSLRSRPSRSAPPDTGAAHHSFFVSSLTSFSQASSPLSAPGGDGADVELDLSKLPGALDEPSPSFWSNPAPIRFGRVRLREPARRVLPSESASNCLRSVRVARDGAMRRGRVGNRCASVPSATRSAPCDIVRHAARQAGAATATRIFFNAIVAGARRAARAHRPPSNQLRCVVRPRTELESRRNAFASGIGEREPLALARDEIARVALVDSVHGEVTSLRAQRGPGSISLCLVDEYETEFDLPRESIDRPFTSAELIRFLAECSPSPLESECQLRISSPFHGDLQALLDEHLERSAE